MDVAGLYTVESPTRKLQKAPEINSLMLRPTFVISRSGVRIRPPAPTQLNMGEFQSGQMGQTVNLLAMPSVVRIHLPPPNRSKHRCLLRFFSYSSMRRPTALQRSPSNMIRPRSVGSILAAASVHLFFFFSRASHLMRMSRKSSYKIKNPLRQKHGNRDKFHSKN